MTCYYCTASRECTGTPPMCADCRKANPEREARVSGPPTWSEKHAVIMRAFPPVRGTGRDSVGPGSDKSFEVTCRVEPGLTLVAEECREIPKVAPATNPTVEGIGWRCEGGDVWTPLTDFFGGGYYVNACGCTSCRSVTPAG